MRVSGAFLIAFSSALALPTSEKWIEKDVCIIGGGASGTYAAVRLKQQHVDVALIEKEGKLGGPVTTYTDSSTGQTYDYGVQVFSNLSVVHSFFHHFDIPLVQLPPPSGGDTKMMNFETGEVVPPAQLYLGNLTEAMLGYAEQQAKYSSIFEDWDLPDPVPEDLLLPFGDFLKKHNLEAFAYIAFLYDQGIANLLAQPTLYVMKYQDRVQIQDLLTGGFVVNGLQNNQLLYDRAAAAIDDGRSLYLNSYPTEITRHSDRVEITVVTKNGVKHIRARKLLVTIPPKSTVSFLDLDRSEQTMFRQFNNSYYWNAILKNTGIPVGTTLPNVNPEAPLNIPAMPGMYTFLASPVPGLHATYYSSPHNMSDEEVSADILSTLQRVRQGAGYPEPEHSPELVALHKWSQFEMTVSNDAIRKGFYNDLLALQGKKNTWWTGATWMNQATATLWRYTEEKVLPHLVPERDILRVQE
ncbi:uncharacterized protein LTR77_007118 [Saxophila tyrrhenica]|uniref:Uncharacterized protein n=1 Tax=Saxophila tyrrhenica TaxID=1690608 RepID=A0AAV9P6R8_9PEZI|nr:hypothetical protein LTR77_007118 [Saxophila tyrrhenica]